MGFFSGIRRRIKKLIPKEIRPAIPFIAAAMIPGPASSGLFKSAIGNQFMAAAAAKAATDDEADLQDIFRTGAIAAAPTAIGSGLEGIAGRTSNEALKKIATKGAEYIANTDGKGLTGLKKVGGQSALDFGIKQAELNEKALEEYNAGLLSRGVRDKAERRSAIFNVFKNAGYAEDEVNDMLDKYGYADGGKVKAMKANLSGATSDLEEYYKKLMEKRVKKAEGGDVKIMPSAAALVAQLIKPIELGGEGMTKEQAMEYVSKNFEDTSEQDEYERNIGSNLQSAVGGLETAFGQPLGGRRLEPMRIIPGFASGGDVDEVMEFDEEIITPEYLMKEEGVPIQEQVSSPDKMDDLNQLSLDMFGRPVFELSEDEFEMLQDFASQQALKPGLIDEYRNYKYQMEEQGITPMSPRDYFRNEFGAARLGVKKGGKVIKIMPEGVLYKGKAKDYPGIKQLIKDMKKKGTRPKKAEGGLMSMGGKELDLRGGGFVPMGKKERADDVPARLSKNEFVMTADAVRAAGGGSVQQGADLMYDTMKKLEAQS